MLTAMLPQIEVKQEQASLKDTLVVDNFVTVDNGEFVTGEELVQAAFERLHELKEIYRKHLGIVI